MYLINLHQLVNFTSGRPQNTVWIFLYKFTINGIIKAAIKCLVKFSNKAARLISHHIYI